MMVILLMLALGLRLISLGQSLWLDEAITANVVRSFNLSEIVTNFSVNDFHPPLYYWILDLWTGIFGYSEISLRMPSVLASLVTIWIVYKMSKGAGWLLAVNPLFVYYSQEARMYSLATLWLTAALWCFTRLNKGFDKSNPYLFGFNVFCLLAMMTFYGSIFLIGAFLIYWLYKREYKLVIWGSMGIVVAGGILAPLLMAQWQNSQQSLNQNWRNVLGQTNLKNLLLIPIKFTSGRISFYPKKIYYLLAGLWLVIVGINIKRNKKWILISVSVGLAAVVSLWVPMLTYFRFLYLLPILALMIKPKTYLIAGFLGWSLAYLMIPSFHREDWKGLAKELQGPTYVVESKADPLIYYGQKTKSLEGEIEGKRIEVIPYGSEIAGFDYQAKLTGYKKIEEKSFRQLRLEVWYDENSE